MGRSEVKREGSGRGNWGTQSDDIAPYVRFVQLVFSLALFINMN